MPTKKAMRVWVVEFEYLDGWAPLSDGAGKVVARENRKRGRAALGSRSEMLSAKQVRLRSYTRDGGR